MVRDWDSKLDMPDQIGRIVVVTGGNTGIGFITCQELAAKGAKVYMLSRSELRAKEAIAQIVRAQPDAEVEFIPFDLCDLKSCKKAAEIILEREGAEGKVHAVIANAGIAGTPYELSVDGIEKQAHNGIGHFALIQPLLPILRKTALEPNSHVRLVQVSSMAHQVVRTAPDFSSLDKINQDYGTMFTRYGHSKLMNILFATELQKRLADTNIYSLSVHPGGVNTEITRGAAQFTLLKPLVAITSPILGYFLLTPYKGAQTQLYAATSHEVEEKNLKGAYIMPIAKVGQKSVIAEDSDGSLAAAFWSLCEKIMADKS